jgi:hypothetical protein
MGLSSLRVAGACDLRPDASQPVERRAADRSGGYTTAGGTGWRDDCSWG